MNFGKLNTLFYKKKNTGRMPMFFFVLLKNVRLSCSGKFGAYVGDKG